MTVLLVTDDVAVRTLRRRQGRYLLALPIREVSQVPHLTGGLSNPHGAELQANHRATLLEGSPKFAHAPPQTADLIRPNQVRAQCETDDSPPPPCQQLLPHQNAQSPKIQSPLSDPHPTPVHTIYTLPPPPRPAAPRPRTARHTRSSLGRLPKRAFYPTETRPS